MRAINGIKIIFAILSLVVSDSLAEPKLRERIEILGPDSGILTEQEWAYIGRSKSIQHSAADPLPAASEFTLRRLTVSPLPSENEADTWERVIEIEAKLQSNPELFTTLAKELSPDQKRRKGGLLSPLTLNQFSDEERSEISKLSTGKISRPLKIGDSYVFYRLE